MFKHLMTLSAILYLVLFLSASLNPAAAEPPKESGGIDPERGEEELIRKRNEWFFSSRRDGATAPLNLLRWAGVLHTQQMMRSQTIQGPGSWTSRGPSPSNFFTWSFGRVSGRVIALARDWGNNILYVGAASGGLWKSTNDGASWTSIFDGAGTTTVGAITIDPNNPSTLWAGTGENSGDCESYFGIGLMRSTDGGATWQQRNGSGGTSLQNLSAFASIIVDPRDSNHIIAGGRYRDCVNGNYFWGGLYTTTDAGATWINRISGAGVDEIIQDPTNMDVYWASIENLGLFRSTDNGVTWNVQTASGLPSGSVGRAEVAMAPSNNNFVYALFADAGGTPQLWRTTNGGSAWSQMASGSNACDGQCWYNMVLRVHITDPNIVYRGTVHIFKSTNGGSTWSDLSGNWGPNQKVHQDTHVFLMDPGNAGTIYVGCDGGIWKSSDGGTTYSNLNGNLNLTQFYAVGNHPGDDNIVCGGAQDNSSLARTSTDTWDLQQVTGDGFVCHFNPVNPDIAYIAGYPDFQGLPSVFRSTNGVFGPFTYITGTASGISAGERTNWVTPYMMDPSSPSTLYLGTQRIYKSTNMGSNWTPVGPSDMTAGNGSVSALEVNRSSGLYVFAGTTDGRVWRSVNGGVFWSNITTGLPARYINDIAGDPSNSARAFCAVGGFGTAHLWEHPGIGNWIARGAGLPDVPANTVFMLSSSEIYVGTDVGVYVSTDSGLNFTPFMAGMPQGTPVTDLKYTAATRALTAGTYGRGAWQYTLPTPPPANDNCGAAKTIGSTPYTDSVDTSTATTEAGDPAPGCGNGSRAKTVWYSYTPPAPGLLTVDTFGSSYNTILAAYTGSCGSMTEAACNDDAGGAQSSITMQVTPGTTYSFLVSAFSSDGGALTFHASFAPASFTVTSPNGGEVWSAGEVHDVTWTSANLSPAGSIYVYYGDGSAWNQIAGPLPVASTSFSWTIPDTPSSVNYVLAGNWLGADLEVADQSNASFAILGSCLFCDDFENGFLSSAWSYASGTWTESGGELHGANGLKKARAYAIPAFSGCSACSVTADMKTAGNVFPGTENKMSLIGWYVDKANNVELLIKESSDKIILKQRVGGRVVAKGKAAVALAPGTTFQAMVAFDGSVFQVRINNVLLLTLPRSSGSSPSGTVGFEVKATTGSFGSITVN